MKFSSRDREEIAKEFLMHHCEKNEIDTNNILVAVGALKMRYYSKFENGKWIDLKELYKPDIINLKSHGLWVSNQLYLHVDFDFENHVDILKSLRSLIRDNISEDDLYIAEDLWEDGEDPGLLLPSIEWDESEGFKEVRRFLAQINEIIAPIINECDGDASGDWFLNDDPLGVATWEWTPEGFKIIGTTY